MTTCGPSESLGYRTPVLFVEFGVKPISNTRYAAFPRLNRANIPESKQGWHLSPHTLTGQTRQYLEGCHLLAIRFRIFPHSRLR